MKIKQHLFLNRQRLDESDLNYFFEVLFHQFHTELIVLRDTIYNYEDHFYLFDQNERTWVGMLNNAILRAFPKQSAMLQEYAVYDTHQSIGRADLLVYWKNKTKEPVYLIFEAKQYTENNKLEMLSDSRRYLNSIMQQAKKYYHAEKKTGYFKNKQVYLVALAIGKITGHEMIEEAKKYFTQHHTQDNSTDFCALFFEDHFGAWLYGKVYPQSNSSAIEKIS